MEKNKDKRTSLEIEHVYYPIIIAIFSFIFAYSYIGNSFERDVTYLGSSDYGQGARDNITVVYMDEIFLDDIESIKFLGQEYVDWPLPYKTQAAIFNRILKYKPKAIFIDLAYLKSQTTIACLMNLDASQAKYTFLVRFSTINLPGLLL